MSAGQIGVSGLQAAKTNMECVANNISNVNTLGYKKVTSNFSDVYSGSGATQTPGYGVKVSSVGQNFAKGSISLTSNALDLSINRGGFLIQKNASSGELSYTVNGRLNLDKDGYLRTSSNDFLQGYSASGGVVSNSQALTNLQISTEAIPAVATTNATIAVNLNADDNEPLNPTFNPASSNTYNYTSDITVYDSLGESHPLTLYYSKVSDNSWNVHASINGTVLNAQTPGVVTYTTTGDFASSSALNGLTYAPNNGANSLSFDVNLSNSTQFSSNYALSGSDQNGFPSASPTGYSIDNSGKIAVTYSSGISLTQGQIALAAFSSPGGLTRTDSMSWLATDASGDPIIDKASSENAFNVGTVEGSNVDLSQELVNLLDSQNMYSANSKVVQTYNETLKELFRSV